jgi:methionyl-tRNA formyltransferase
LLKTIVDRRCILRIDILVDNPKSWIIEYLDQLLIPLRERSHLVSVKHSAEALEGGDIAFFLSCERLVRKEVLKRHLHNLVCHPSPLPLGRGWSPLAWQILEGRSEIPVTLFEAVDEVDAGPIYDQEWLHFRGHELNGEIKQAQAAATTRLCLRFVDQYPNVVATPQVGLPTFFRRRTASDSELDPSRPLADQFDLLRVVDNDRYPASSIIEATSMSCGSSAATAGPNSSVGAIHDQVRVGDSQEIVPNV